MVTIYLVSDTQKCARGGPWKAGQILQFETRKITVKHTSRVDKLF